MVNMGYMSRGKGTQQKEKKEKSGGLCGPASTPTPTPGLTKEHIDQYYDEVSDPRSAGHYVCLL